MYDGHFLEKPVDSFTYRMLSPTEINNRKILEDLQLKKQQLILQKGVSPVLSAISPNFPVYTANNVNSMPLVETDFNNNSRNAHVRVLF